MKDVSYLFKVKVNHVNLIYQDKADITQGHSSLGLTLLQLTDSSAVKL